MARPDTSQIKALLESARSISIFLPQSPHYDAAASGLALKVALESQGKTVTVICPEPMTVEFNRLVGVDTVTSEFGSRNLLITFGDQTEHVDKVSYNLDKGELQLVITPKTNVPDLDPRRLKYISGTSKSDLAFLISVHQLPDLGQLYQDSRDFFTNTKIVSVTRDLPGTNYTPHQIFDTESSSVSELMAHLIESVGIPLPPDAATNLLAGLDIATDSFQSHLVTHTTFETAAHLLKRGARRSQPLDAAGFPPGSIPGQVPPPAASASSPAQSGWGTDSQDQPSDNAQKNHPPEDWYEPKIYRGPPQP